MVFLFLFIFFDSFLLTKTQRYNVPCNGSGFEDPCSSTDCSLFRGSSLTHNLPTTTYHGGYNSSSPPLKADFRIHQCTTSTAQCYIQYSLYFLCSASDENTIELLFNDSPLINRTGAESNSVITASANTTFNYECEETWGILNLTHRRWTGAGLPLHNYNTLSNNMNFSVGFKSYGIPKNVWWLLNGFSISCNPVPTQSPTKMPTTMPTMVPTSNSNMPTINTQIPTSMPTMMPSAIPSMSPTTKPSTNPTPVTGGPTTTAIPTTSPTVVLPVIVTTKKPLDRDIILIIILVTTIGIICCCCIFFIFFYCKNEKEEPDCVVALENLPEYTEYIDPDAQYYRSKTYGISYDSNNEA